MQHGNLFAYDPRGGFLVSVVGSDLLVYSVDDGAELWRDGHEGKIVGVGASEEEIVSVDDQGRLVWWEPETGERNDEVDVDGDVVALAVDADGVAAAITPEKVLIIDPGDAPRSIDLEDAVCLAWAGTGGRLAVGTSGGQVVVIEDQDLRELGVVDLQEPVTGIGWSSAGYWLAATGTAVHRVAPDAARSSLLGRYGSGKSEGAKKDSKLQWLTVSPDGTLLAARVGVRTGVVLELPSLEVAARATYAERKVQGLGFGPKPWLGIGLDGGGANRISMKTGTVRAALPHGSREGLSSELSLEGPLLDGSAAGGRGRSGTPARAKAARSERELNAPTVQTLLMLGTVSAATLLMWGAAKFACNLHPPESKKPREVGTMELAATPKSAAVEMIHRLASHNYEGALELAAGEAAQAVEKAFQECKSGGDAACAAQRNRLEGRILTTAEVLTHKGGEATAKVTARIGTEETKQYDVQLEREGQMWRVVRHKAL